MKEEKYPITQAVRFLRAKGLKFSAHLYEYVDHGGTEEAARQLGFDEHAVVKTIVFENELHRPLFVLMHGDREVSAQKIGRFLSAKRITPCAPKDVTKHTGYMVGGTSPFGSKRELPVYVEKTILDLPLAYINGGKRGFLVGVDPKQAVQVLSAPIVEVAA